MLGATSPSLAPWSAQWQGGWTAGPRHSLQGRQPVVGQQGLGQEGGTFLLDGVVLQAARGEKQGKGL